MKNRTIWIIDDDTVFLEELREALALSGYGVEAFPNAASARKRMRESVPDLVLLDLKMDGENGFQFAYDLKHQPLTSRVPVIAMTGHYTRAEHAMMLNHCGIEFCLIKPLVLTDLLERMEILLKEAAGGRGRRAARPARP